MTTVDWNAVDAMFRFIESPTRSGRALNGYAASGFVAAAVMTDPAGDLDAWWETLLGVTTLPGGANAQIRRGFSENWRDVEAGFRRGRFVPSVPAPGELGHDEALADFCEGFLQVLDSSRAAAALVAGNSAATQAAAALRRRVVRCAAAQRGLFDKAAVADALSVLYSATADLRLGEVATETRRAA